MDLEQAIDYLAKNCPHVFAPIAEEMDRLKTENKTFCEKMDLTQNALNDLIFKVTNGGI
ncbi:hypothetical protein LZ906_006785 [Paraclostridium ghonii]|uniref:hypothetical protein n=1 Tax=Paraclostridium ghonii TaxID=29358 RepID=UPI00202CA9F6|nr:hypothetical protein [Paeniclostridium ghonii]MCM0165922.1 hypothetical protein [Paeniclostridium ghonii]